jgi:hypothetical protein
LKGLVYAKHVFHFAVGEPGNPFSKGREFKLEVGGMKYEVGGRKYEVGRMKSEA